MKEKRVRENPYSIIFYALKHYDTCFLFDKYQLGKPKDKPLEYQTFSSTQLMTYEGKTGQREPLFCHILRNETL